MANYPLHILIVEDDPDIREVLTLVLDMEGFSVQSLENGHDVQKSIQADRPDVLLLDVMLGDMDGRDICEELKSDPSTRAIPIMIVSASHGYMDDRQDCGADDYLAKPFDIGELVLRVRKLAA